MIKLPVGLTRTFGKAALFTKRHLPEILTYGGIGATIGGTALMCRATIRADRIMTDANDQIEAETDEAVVKDIRRKARRDVAKEFILPAAVEGAGVGMILGGHHVMRKENLVLAASNAAMAAAFAKYRKRVRAEMDELREQKCFIESQMLANEENDLVLEEECAPEPGVYTAIFDELNPNWSRNPNDNAFFLKNAEQRMTQRLHAKGYLFLNEVLYDLGCTLTPAGQYVGWVDSGYQATSYVDFGLPAEGKLMEAFKLGEGVLLDFNVDGDIMYILGGNRMHEIQEEGC